MQEITQKMGNPLREMIITAGQRLQDYLDSYKHSKKVVLVEDPAVSNASTEEDAAWEKLQKLFSEVAERQNFVQKLQVSMRLILRFEVVDLMIGSVVRLGKSRCAMVFFLRFWCQPLLNLSRKH